MEETVKIYLPSGQTCRPGEHAWGWKRNFNKLAVYVVACFVTDETASWIDNQEFSSSSKVLWSRDLGKVQETFSTCQDGQLEFMVSSQRTVVSAGNKRTVIIYYDGNSDSQHTYRLGEQSCSLSFSESCVPDGYCDDLEFALAAINSSPSLVVLISRSFGRHASRSITSTGGQLRILIVNCIMLLTWLMHGLTIVSVIFEAGCYVLSLCHSLQVSTLGRLAITRKQQYNDCIRHVKDKANSSQQRLSANMAWSVGVDMLLGVIVSLWLLSHDNMSLVCIFINESGQETVRVVKTQLNWLMGVPAGLKLNSALDQFLGEFFLYLISIWSAYLQAVVAPILPIVVSSIALSSCLGVSVLLALSADMLSLMTFHIYCFYVFAAKIYHVQVYALGSLWRLFTGKKWNVLRSRVDSCEYKVDQLLLGTLLFTVLLFLLPTVAMYYLVFTLLRISVLALHMMISIPINLLTRIPVYGLLIRLFDPLQLPGGIKMNMKTPLKSCPQSLYLSLQVSFIIRCCVQSVLVLHTDLNTTFGE